VQLINRFYDPLQGDIEFDGENLKQLSMKSLREMIGYVSQEPVLILGTIRENLLYGNMEATEDDLKEALRMANASFVNTLEQGLDSYVGAASVMNLSGGQK
jgi:ABC-type multidrug transport system fused ATPase/permease subunit